VPVTTGSDNDELAIPHSQHFSADIHAGLSNVRELPHHATIQLALTARCATISCLLPSAGEGLLNWRPAGIRIPASSLR